MCPLTGETLHLYAASAVASAVSVKPHPHTQTRTQEQTCDVHRHRVHGICARDMSSFVMGTCAAVYHLAAMRLDGVVCVMVGGGKLCEKL